jgi:hypothetical protein
MKSSEKMAGARLMIVARGLAMSGIAQFHIGRRE